MKTRELFGTLLVVLSTASNLQADTPAPPRDYKTLTKDDRYVFVMLAPYPVAGQPNPIRKQYSRSGLYRNDGSTNPLWTVDWYSFKVYVSSDGEHLVRMGPWPSSFNELALAFCRNGKEIRRYTIDQLVDYPDLLPHSVSHFQWQGDISFDDDHGRLALATLQAQRYVFDLKSGEILQSEKDPIHPSALFHAAQKGDVAGLQTLLAKGADANARDPAESGMRPLVAAASFGQADAVQVLLDWGADANLGGVGGAAPLVFAAGLSGDPATVRVLLEAGADVNTKDWNGNTALTIAEHERHVAAAEMLRKWGATSAPTPSPEGKAVSKKEEVGQNLVSALALQKATERALSSGQTHSYQVALAAGQFAHATVVQKGIDVIVSVFDPDSRKVGEFDTPIGPFGPEPVYILAEKSGTYRLEVRPFDANARPGHYEIRLDELRQSTLQDKSRVAAQLRSKELDDKFVRLDPQRDPVEALKAGQESLRAAEEAFGARSQQIGARLLSLSMLYLDQGRPAEAEASARRSLAIAENDGGPDSLNVAQALTILAAIVATQGRPEEAVPLLERALSIWELAPESGASSLREAWEMYVKLLHSLDPTTLARISSSNAIAIDANALGAMLLAAVQGDLAAMQKLIKAGANVNEKNKYGVTPLLAAALNSHPDVVEALLGAGANPNAKIRNGMTPLMFAARRGNIAIARALLGVHADINAKASSGATALQLARLKLHSPVVELLKQAGAAE